MRCFLLLSLSALCPLLSATPPNVIFFFDLRSDPGESADLAEKYPDILARLRQLHEAHLR